MNQRGKRWNTVPRGWLKFSKHGEPIPGCPFVALKTPLRKDILVYGEYSFTPNAVLKQLPHLKLIINLTGAPNGRFYNFREFQQVGVGVRQIVCHGHGVIPNQYLINKFFRIVDDFLDANPDAHEGVIGVHCTHGLNRTGFFICKFLIDRLHMTAHAAIELFESTRGHVIERENYRQALGLQHATHRNVMHLGEPSTSRGPYRHNGSRPSTHPRLEFEHFSHNWRNEERGNHASKLRKKRERRHRYKQRRRMNQENK